MDSLQEKKGMALSEKNEGKIPNYLNTKQKYNMCFN
jgi:hypothetical protein